MAEIATDESANAFASSKIEPGTYKIYCRVGWEPGQPKAPGYPAFSIKGAHAEKGKENPLLLWEPLPPWAPFWNESFKITPVDGSVDLYTILCEATATYLTAQSAEHQDPNQIMAKPLGDDALQQWEIKQSGGGSNAATVYRIKNPKTGWVIGVKDDKTGSKMWWPYTYVVGQSVSDASKATQGWILVKYA